MDQNTKNRPTSQVLSEGFKAFLETKKSSEMSNAAVLCGLLDPFGFGLDEE